MEVISLGVGESVDTLSNNSHLVVSEKMNIVLDFGYLVPPQWLKLGVEADFLHAVFLSHEHPDHCGGLSHMLMDMCKGGRKEPLAVICHNGVRNALFEKNRNVWKRLPLCFVEAVPGATIELDGLEFSFAPTGHTVDNLAVRVSDGKHSVCYSGDGQFLPATEKLYLGADVLIHETYTYDNPPDGHACIVDTVAMAERQGVKTLMLTHLCRRFRKHGLPKVRDKITSSKVKILIPEPMDRYRLD